MVNTIYTQSGRKKIEGSHYHRDGLGRLCQLSNFGWSIAKNIYTPQKGPKEETWENLKFLGITT